MISSQSDQVLVTIGLLCVCVCVCVCVKKWAETLSIKCMSICVLGTPHTAHTVHVSNVISHSMQSCIPQRSLVPKETK